MIEMRHLSMESIYGTYVSFLGRPIDRLSELASKAATTT